MNDCTSPEGHAWTKWYHSVDDFGDRWMQFPVTNYRDHTSQMVRCVRCEDTAYLVMSPV